MASQKEYHGLYTGSESLPNSKTCTPRRGLLSFPILGMQVLPECLRGSASAPWQLRAGLQRASSGVGMSSIPGDEALGHAKAIVAATDLPVFSRP